MAKEKAVAVKEKKESKLKKAFVKAFDENGNGQVDINEIIKCLQLPGVRINRTDFLREPTQEDLIASMKLLINFKKKNK